MTFSDQSDDSQERIVSAGGLPVLVPLLASNDTETVTAAVAALRNLSIHKGNEVRESEAALLCRPGNGDWERGYIHAREWRVGTRLHTGLGVETGNEATCRPGNGDWE